MDLAKLILINIFGFGIGYLLGKLIIKLIFLMLNRLLERINNMKRAKKENDA